jgi:hypothetical protein
MRPLPSLRAAPIDWPRVERWEQDLAADRLDRIRTGFAAGGIGGLELARSPEPAALQGTANRFLLEYWLAEQQGAMPPASAIDPIRMRPALGRILIVEPIEQGWDFRYRLFGTLVAAVSGYDMTGKLLSAHPLAPEMVCFAFALYRGLLVRPEPVMTMNVPPMAHFARWERIVLPFAGPGGEVTRFVVGNVGFDRDGREMRA